MYDLKYYLVQFGRRMRIRNGWSLAQSLLWLACSISLLTQILGRFVPLEGLWMWTLAPYAIWLLGVVGFSILRPISLMHIARRADLELRLYERLSTCLQLLQLQDTNKYVYPASIVEAQRQDALRIARGIQPKNAFPLHWKKWSLMISGLLISTVLVLAVLPNPMNRILEQRAAIKQATKEQAERIEKLSQEVELSQNLTPDERQEITRLLVDLADKLRSNPGDLEQAMADLSKVEQRLLDKLDPDVAMRQADLETLVEEMQALAGKKVDPNQNQLEAAEAALNMLVDQTRNMDPSQKQSLTEALAQRAAQASQSGNMELAQALASLAQAIQSGDQIAAQKSVQQVKNAMANLQQQLQQQAAIQQMLSQLQTGRQAIAQAGQTGAKTQRQGQTSGQGESQAPGQGQQPGTGQQGQPGGGGGTTAKTLPPGMGQGSAKRPQGSGSGNTGADLDQQVYVPREISQSGGNEMYIPGQDTGQGETQVSEGDNPLPGTITPALVPYYQVFYDYLNAANLAMDQVYIPASLLDYIREYFSQLEP
jgi:septal ring factor EnvC (AmiA/AmiB activator)